MYQIAHKYSKIVGNKYNTSEYSEDIAQEVLLQVITKQGDVVENLDEKDALEMIKRYMMKAIRLTHGNQVPNKRLFSLDQKIGDDNKTLYDKIAGSDDVYEKVEAKEIEKVMIKKSETLISEIQEYIKTRNEKGRNNFMYNGKIWAN